MQTYDLLVQLVCVSQIVTCTKVRDLRVGHVPESNHRIFAHPDESLTVLPQLRAAFTALPVTPTGAEVIRGGSRVQRLRGSSQRRFLLLRRKEDSAQNI